MVPVFIGTFLKEIIMGAEGYEKLDRTLVHKGVVISFYKEHMKLPNGNEADWDYIAHPGGAACLPVTQDNEVLLVSQYRNSQDRITLEIPAGKRDGNESNETTALRELEEETGFKTDKVTRLTDTIPAVGYSDEVLGLFYADNLIPSEQMLDDDEKIDIVKLPLKEAVEMCVKGKIIDSKTVTAILMYAFTVAKITY